MDRSRSKAVLVYYDIGNSSLNGFNVVREIDWLGKKADLPDALQR